MNEQRRYYASSGVEAAQSLGVGGETPGAVSEPEPQPAS